MAGEMRVTLAELQHDPDRVGVTVEGDDGSGVEIEHLELDDSSLIRTRLTGSRLRGVRLSSSSFDDCELSGVQFPEGSLFSVRLSNCKLVGADLSDVSLTDVTFESCVLSAASFRLARLLRVHFDNCDLQDTDFYGTKMRDVVMSRSRLEATDFAAAQITDLDLRSSTLVSIENIAGLANATIDELQAAALGVQLAGSIGIRVTADKQLESYRAEPASTGISSVGDAPDDADRSSSTPTEALAHLAELRSSLKGVTNRA